MTDETGYTYEDAARLCGVSSETIRQRARRGSIRRGRRTNSGRPTVLLTQDELRAIRGDRSQPDDPVQAPGSNRTDDQPDATGQPDGRSDEPAELVTLLRDQLARAEARVERLEVREGEARVLAERQARELTASLLRTAIAETEARALREALDVARASWVERLIRAWRRPGRGPG